MQEVRHGALAPDPAQDAVLDLVLLEELPEGLHEAALLPQRAQGAEGLHALVPAASPGRVAAPRVLDQARQL